MNSHRVNIISLLQLIERKHEQDEYQNEVPYVGVATEMCCQWFDDFYHPHFSEFISAFSEEELQEFEKFNDIFEKHVKSLPETLPELWLNQGWLEISAYAASIIKKFNWQDLRPKYDPE